MNAPHDLGKKQADPISAMLVLGLVVVFVWPLLILFWALRRPVGLATLGALILSCVWIGAATVYALAQWIVLFTIVGLAGWRLTNRESFDEHAAWRISGLWRKHWIYRRKWRQTMRNHGLHVVLDNRRDRTPRLMKFTNTPWADHLLVRPVKGSMEDFQAHAKDFATAFDAPRCRLREHHKHHDRFWLVFPRVDRLAKPIPPPQQPEEVDLERVTVGLCEDGEPWQLCLLGGHLLLSGQTGAGKSTLIWSILWSIGPLIRDGLVQVWAVDPKGGMELYPGRKLFTRYADKDIEEMTKILEDAVAYMERRMDWAKENGIRKHEPSTKEPFILVIVDEAAVMKLRAEDSDVKKLLDRCQNLLLMQGRAPGVTLVSALQEPTKAMLDTRGLYPNRAIGRSLEPLHAGMILGPNARERGAETEKIEHKGCMYFTIEGETELMLGRAFYIENHHISTLVHLFAPRPKTGPQRLREVLEGSIVDEPTPMSDEQRVEAAATARLLNEGPQQ
jgi:DNA segregation ATPase FtsK/SpoIIIE, S-DNA-T family